jgi:hypothetical protein
MLPTDSENLRGLIAFREGLESADRGLLDEHFTWPLQLVIDGPQPVGFVMAELEDDWRHSLTLTTKRERHLREAKWLIADAASGERVGVELPAPGAGLERLTLCAMLARVFALLHRDGLVYGDLQPLNVVYQLRPVPRLRMVDCDSVKVVSDFRQPNQAQWVAPEGADKPQTPETDCYKLALFVLRCVANGKGSSVTRDIRRASQPELAPATGLDDVGLEMLARGLGSEPHARPTARDWYAYLRQFINVLSSPPQVLRIDVSDRMVFSGTRVTVSWHAQGAGEIYLETSDGMKFPQDTTSPTGAADIAVVRSGAVTIVATNDFGTNRVHSEPINVFEPPQLRFVQVPEPPLPANLGIEGPFNDALRRAVGTTPVEVQLPPLPSLVSADPEQSLPSCAAAVDVDVAGALGGLSEVLDAINGSARQLQLALGGVDSADAANFIGAA